MKLLSGPCPWDVGSATRSDRNTAVGEDRRLVGIDDESMSWLVERKTFFVGWVTHGVSLLVRRTPSKPRASAVCDMKR